MDPREHDPTNALISPGTTTGVQSRAAEPFTADYPVHWGARVHAVGANGEGCTELRDTRGDPERPIPLAQLNAKVGELLASVGVTERQSRELVETVSRLPDGHVADLGTVLP